MIFDIQRAGVWKRICAAFLDLILLAVLASGIAWAMSAVTGFDSYAETVSRYTEVYSEKYPVYFSVTSESELEALSSEEKAEYESQKAAFAADEAAQAEYQEAAEANAKAVGLTLVITAVSVLVSVSVLEIGVPLLMKNGMTVGKKIFGLALVRQDCVKISPFMLIVRSIFGKYLLEIMVPVCAVIGLYFGVTGLLGIIVPVGLLLMQLVLLFAGRNRQVLHDMLSCTVVVDYQSQRIFADAEALLEARKKAALEESSKSNY